MKEISLRKIEMVKRKCSFFNFDKFCAEIEMRIQFEPKDEIVRFGEFSVWEDDLLFHYEMKRLLDMVKTILKGEKRCLVLKDHKKWIADVKRGKKLYAFLKKHGISNRKTEGMILEPGTEWKEIQLLVKSVFQCNTNAIFILPESKAVLIPTDHMDLFVYCERIETMEKIGKNIMSGNLTSPPIYQANILISR